MLALAGLRKHPLDQFADNYFKKLHRLIDRNTDGSCFIANFTAKTRRKFNTFFAKLVLDEQKGDLPLANTVHGGLLLRVATKPS